MLTTGCKSYLAAAAAFLVTAWIYGWSTGAGYLLGPITLGYKGGVGEHVGYTILLGSAVCSFLLALLLVALRDADVTPSTPDTGQDATASVEGTSPASPPSPSPWPLLTAASTGLCLVGIVYNPLVVAIGLGALAVSIVAWAQQTVDESAVRTEVTSDLPDEAVYLPPALPVALVAGGRVLAAASLLGGLVFTLYALSQNVASIFIGPVVIGLALVARSVVEWYAETQSHNAT